MQRLALALLLILLAAPAAQAADTPIKSLFDTLTGNEADKLKASDGDAERDGANLILWLTGYGDHERGLIFHNWSRAASAKAEGDGNSFVYYGKVGSWSGTTPFAYLVEENFSHDAPMLYLIETDGREHRFHVGDQQPYLTPSAQHILATGDVEIAAANGASQPMLFQILGLHVASNVLLGYREELTCNAYQDQPNLTAEPVVLTDDAITLAIGDGRQALGNLDLKRDGWHWKMTAPGKIMSQLSCTAPKQ